MTTNLENLDPDSPEFEEALRAAEAVAGEESDDEIPGDEAEQRPQQEAAEGEAEQPDDQQATADGETGGEAEDAADAAQPPEHLEQPTAPQKVAGVASKDGKHVLPYAALKGAREEAKAERDARLAAEAKAAALEQQIADLKAGKRPEAEADDGLDDEALQDLAIDFPAIAKLANSVKTMRETIKNLTTAAPAKQEQSAEPSDDPVQDAIDAVPTLAAWQYGDHEKFNRAVQHDAVLKTSPKWRDKPLAERFAEATRRAAEEFDEPVDEQPVTQQTNKPAAQQAKPTTPKAPVRRPPSTLSDFKGGAGNTKTDDIRGLDAPAGVRAFERMSDAEIDDYLRRVEG